MVVTWDGSVGEGGGQSVRVAVALAGLLGQSVQVINIRGNRRVGGLRAQHVAGITAVANITGAVIDGCSVGSRTLLVNAPRSEVTTDASRGAPIDVTIATAGSITLVLQAALPVALRCFASGIFAFRGGGTIVGMAPLMHYFVDVFGKNIQDFGVSMECDIITHGFYPRGCAKVDCRFGIVKERCLIDIETGNQYLKPVYWLKRGTAVRVTGMAFIAGAVGNDVAERMAASASKLLRKRLRQEDGFCGEIDIKFVFLNKSEAVGNIAAIFLKAEMSTGLMLGASAIGAKGVRSEKVGADAAGELCDALDSGGAVDPHMADQLIIMMIMAKGKSQVLTGEPTLHLKTVIDEAKAFGVDASLEKVENSATWLVSVTGKAIAVHAKREND